MDLCCEVRRSCCATRSDALSTANVLRLKGLIVHGSIQHVLGCMYLKNKNTVLASILGFLPFLNMT